VEIGVFWLLKMCAKLLKCATINLAEMNFYSSLEYLVVETSRKAGHWPFSAHIGVRPCRILDMDVVEFHFPDVR
jgi:hypothetical protein